MKQPTIQHAIDPETEEIVDAQAGVLEHKEYRCIKGNGRLILRQGSIQTWHFAHYGGEEQPSSCPLYYAGNYDSMLEEMRTHEIETALRNRRLRLVVSPRPYGHGVRLFGLMPTLNWEEVRSNGGTSVIHALRIRAEGSKTQPRVEDFHAREGEALIELDPDAGEFVVECECAGDKELSITGRWTGESIRDGDVFVGVGQRAERSEVEAVEWDDTVYVVTSDPPERLPPIAIRYRMGRWSVTSFEVKRPTVDLLEDLSGEKWEDMRPFQADVVFPPYADPRSRGPVRGQSDSQAIVAVFPPAGMDPTFEVVSVPLGDEDAVTLPKLGSGTPRWVRADFPAEGARRYSIHWKGRHRDVLVGAAVRGQVSNCLADYIDSEPTIGIQSEEAADEVVGLFRDTEVKVRCSEEISGLSDLGIEVQVPPGFRFDVLAGFVPGSDVGPTVHCKQVTVDKFESKLHGWIREGLQKVLLEVEALGRVEVVFDTRDRTTVREERVVREGACLTCRSHYRWQGIPTYRAAYCATCGAGLIRVSDTTPTLARFRQVRDAPVADYSAMLECRSAT